jgi:hypothetical protein
LRAGGLALCSGPSRGGCSSVVEHRIVAPGVAGSNPVTHPARLPLEEGIDSKAGSSKKVAVVRHGGRRKRP